MTDRETTMGTGGARNDAMSSQENALRLHTIEWAGEEADRLASELRRQAAPPTSSQRERVQNLKRLSETNRAFAKLDTRNFRRWQKNRRHLHETFTWDGAGAGDTELAIRVADLRRQRPGGGVPDASPPWPGASPADSDVVVMIEGLKRK